MTVRPLSQLLLDIRANFDGQEAVSIDQLLEAFHERGFGFFLFIFALPAALPLPAVGIGTIISLPLLFLTTQQVIGRKTIWLPNWLKQKKMSRPKLDGMIDKALPWMARIEVLIKPRLSWITKDRASKFFSFLAFVMTIAVLFPIPMTNTFPALGIALIGIGIIMRDGLAILAGAFIGITWITMLVSVIILFGGEGIQIMKDIITSIF